MGLPTLAKEDQLRAPPMQQNDQDFNHPSQVLSRETVNRRFQVTPALPQTNEHPIRTLFVFIVISQVTKILCPIRKAMVTGACYAS